MLVIAIREKKGDQITDLLDYANPEVVNCVLRAISCLDPKLKNILDRRSYELRAARKREPENAGHVAQTSESRHGEVSVPNR